ncbi:DKNYY domain-containing protein [Candidatus Gracilibacteria bacterium]|nr:DKNYY domain-containing protein [Candidatus Gracilibacteria bacterium]
MRFLKCIFILLCIITSHQTISAFNGGDGYYKYADKIYYGFNHGVRIALDDPEIDQDGFLMVSPDFTEQQVKNSKEDLILQDDKNFIILGFDIAKNRQNLYIRGEKIEKHLLDLETLVGIWKPIKNNALYYDKYDTLYYSDKNGSYWYNIKSGTLEPILGIDNGSFEILEGHYNFQTSYAKDKYNVYYDGKVIDGADPQAFQIIKYGNITRYSKDRNSVYLLNKKIEWADPKSFTVISSSYIKDQNNVYYGDLKIEGADSMSFKSMGEYYGDGAKDNYGIYKSGIKLPNIDPLTYDSYNQSDFFSEYSLNGSKKIKNKSFSSTFMKKLQVKLGEAYQSISDLDEDKKQEKIEAIENKIYLVKSSLKYQNPNHQRFLNYLLATLRTKHNFE